MTEMTIDAPVAVPVWNWKKSEEALLAALLAAMVILPITEIAARLLGLRGIPAVVPVVQHCTLPLSMIGAAIAARRERLLSIGTTAILPQRVRPAAAATAACGAATVAALLGMASIRYVITERQSGAILAWGIPLWLIEAVLPLGFAAIALRIVATMRGRGSRVAAAAFVLAAVAYAAIVTPIPNAVVIVSFIATVLLAAAGAPIFAVLGAIAIASYWATGVPIAAMSVSHYSLVVNPSLPAIPLFTLAGYILAEGGASRRLVAVFDAFVGGIRGGPAIVTVLACAFFTTFTGGSGVTILALGGLLLPILLNARVSDRNAVGFVTAAGALGILFPPCLPMILYAIAAGVDVRRLFMAGIIPGVLLLVLTAWLGWMQQPPVPSTRRFDWRAALSALRQAKWELALPFIVAALLFGGIATAVEASAVTALYAFFIEAVVHREGKSWDELLHAFTESGLLVGGVLLILGVALGLTGFLIDAEVPQRAVEIVTASVHSRVIFLLLLNLFLIVVGALMDIYSAIIVVVPLIVPLGAAFGIDPVHLGVIFLTNLELGYLIPPVGENLFIAAYRFDRPVGELARAVLPMVGVLLVGVLMVTYMPQLSMMLSR